MGNIHFKWGIFNSSREYSLKVGNIHFNWRIFTSTGEYSLQLGNIHFNCWEIFTSSGGYSPAASQVRVCWAAASLLQGAAAVPWMAGSSSPGPAMFKILHQTQSGPAIFKILHLTLMFLLYSKYYISHNLVLPYSKYYISHLCSCHIQNVTSQTIWSCHFQNITSHTIWSWPAIFKILHLTLMFLPYLKYYIRHSWSCHIQNILSRTYGPAIFRRSDHTSHDNFKLRALFQRNQNSFPTSDPSPVSELCTWKRMIRYERDYQTWHNGPQSWVMLQAPF